jgi:PKD repeat protein
LDSENKVNGWAKALVDGGGWSGWIRLRDTNYGAWLDTSISPQEFRGWAWSDMVVGWISFNCRDRNVCPSSNYKVYLTNQPPTVSNPYETQDSCAWGKSPQVAPGLVITLHWTYSDPEGDLRSAFEIWLDDSSNFQDPKFNKIFNISSSESSQSYVLNLSDDQEGDWLNRLAWGTTYYWKVRVKDSAGNWSNWSTVDSFITPSHASPYVNFNWSPQNPTVNQVVQFTDLSECYDSSDNIVPCSSWYWTFQNGNPPSSTNQNPTTTFSSVGSNLVTLRVTDSSGYWCENSKTVRSTYPLPFWQEIPPPIFFKMRKFLASLILVVSRIKPF